MPSERQTVLVTGAAGYIGSHTALDLIRAGYDVVTLDSYVRGHAAALDRIEPIARELGRTITRVRADIRDTARVEQAIVQSNAGAVIHFAAYAKVAESVTHPLLYWSNNTGGTVSLLQAIDNAASHGVRVQKLVFSSTCATYGEPEITPIDETTPQSPVNPYGASKLAMEHAIIDYVSSRAADQSPLSATILRYFNVAGCDPDGLLGEDATPHSRVVPILIEAALGLRPAFKVFGTDYPTPDGTAIRDYVHVSDLARAHTLALDKRAPGSCDYFNVGTGSGFSVQQLLDIARSVTGSEIPAENAPRRAGDPPELVAKADKIRAALNWKPEYPTPEHIIQSAWNWFLHNPSGYAIKGAGDSID